MLVLLSGMAVVGYALMRSHHLQISIERLTAEAKEARGREADARQALTTRTAEAGRHAERLLRTACKLTSEGHIDDALQLADLVLALSPEDAEAHLLCGVLRASQRDYDGTVRALERHGEYVVDEAAMELLSACRSAAERETSAIVAGIVWQLKHRGFPALARHLESSRVPGLLGSWDASFGDILNVLEAWDAGGLLSWAADAPEADARGALLTALELARRCRWMEASRQLREALSRPAGQKLQNGVSAAFAFAFDLAGERTPEDVAGLFTATKASFDPEAGTLSLHYGHGAPRAWETGDRMADEGGAIVLRPDNRLPFLIPFRRDADAQTARFRGRLMGLAPPSVVWLCWEAGWEDAVPRYAGACLAGGEDGRDWGAAGSFGPGMEPPEEAVRPLPSRYGKAWHTLEAVLRPERGEFEVGDAELWVVRLAGSGPCRLTLAGREKRVHLDWIEISGAPDGIWLARQLLLRRRELAETRHAEWRPTWLRD